MSEELFVICEHDQNEKPIELGNLITHAIILALKRLRGELKVGAVELAVERTAPVGVMTLCPVCVYRISRELQKHSSYVTPSMGDIFARIQ